MTNNIIAIDPDDIIHSKTYPLPRTDFMYDRHGPWPQPAPDHPMAMAAEVLHPAQAEVKDWNRTAGWNYTKALITKFPLALRNWFINNKISHITDGYFSSRLTTTTYSKYLRPQTIEDLKRSDFSKRVKHFDPNLQYYTMDFTPMQDIAPYKGVFVAPTFSLFCRENEDAPFHIVSISIGHLEGDMWKHVVLLPEDSNAWMIAKYFVLQGAAHMVVLSGHPATHFPYDTVNAVTQSALPMHHTLFKLLKPHLRLQLAVDHAVLEGGHSIVSESRGEFYAPFAGPSETVRQLVAAGYVGYPHPLSKYNPGNKPGKAYPKWTYPHKPRDIPSDFGKVLEAYYATVKKFVRKVVDHILDNIDTDKGKEELYYIQIWARYIAHWLPGFPNEDEIFGDDDRGEPLVTAVTTFIWDVSIAHSLDHRAFGLLGPHHTPFRVRVPPPDSPEAPHYHRSEILSGWDMFKSTLGFEMFFKPHNVQLLKDIKYDFSSETLLVAAEEFHKDLRATEEALVADGVDIENYVPLKDIACSIQY